jgi:hypothetical protein
MVIFEHINTKKTVGLNYKVLFNFLKNSEEFNMLQEYPQNIESICLDYFLIRHPVLRVLSFYKNKLYDFYGFEFLSNEFITELSKLVKIDLFPYKIHNLEPAKEIYKKLRSKETFLEFIENLHIYKNLDPHLYPQTKYLDIISYKKIIRIETDLNLLKKDFPDLNFKIRVNKSNMKNITHYIDKNIEEKVRRQYNNDYVIGLYN